MVGIVSGEINVSVCSVPTAAVASGALVTAEKKWRRSSTISKEDIALLHFECLTQKKENLALKRRKLELEIALL